MRGPDPLDKVKKLTKRNPKLGVSKMPMKASEATLSTFGGVLEKFTTEAANNKANFILFLADNDPSTNRSWCPGTNLAPRF